MRRSVRNSLISALIIVGLFLAAGTAYTLFSDQKSPKQKPLAVGAATVSTPLAAKPTPPAPNAPVGVGLGSLTSPVSIGSNALLSVSTTAGANCVITVTYNNIVSKDSGLAPKTADAYGVASWSWTIDGSVPVGSWPIKVTCTYHGRSGVFDTNLQVTK